MNKHLIFLGLLLFFTIYSCKNSNDQSERQKNDVLANAEYMLSDETGKRETIEPVTIDKRKLIKTGVLTFESKHLENNRKELEILVKKNEGYFSSEKQYNYTGRLEYELVIRIPSEKFDTLIDAISKMVEKFDGKNIHVSDVSEEFVDIESRLKTKKDLENRYRELLTKAHTVDEILAIERQAGELRAEIESMEGRLKYLQSQVAYSTLTINFYKEIQAGNNFIGKFKKGFISGWNNLIWFFVGITHVWTFVLLIGLGLFLLFKRLKKSN